MSLKKNITAFICALLITAFTIYVLMDTFVIKRVYAVVDGTESSADTSGGSPSAIDTTAAETGSSTDTSDAVESPFTSETVVTASSYSDSNISITITEYREYDTSIYVADIYVSSPEYLKTAFAENSYGRNITETTSSIAENAGAVLAINGDYYGSQSKGYVIRNGVLYRETVSSGQEDLVIGSDGSFTIVSEGEISASKLLESGAEQVLSFGPALLVDGEITVDSGDEVGKAMASNPRTAICYMGDCHYLFVVSDGRTTASEGLSLYELAEFLQSIGAVTAYNLDGGGSSTMYFNGTVVNNPTTNGNSIKERSVSDIVYIG